MTSSSYVILSQREQVGNHSRPSWQPPPHLRSVLCSCVRPYFNIFFLKIVFRQSQSIALKIHWSVAMETEIKLRFYNAQSCDRVEKMPSSLSSRYPSVEKSWPHWHDRRGRLASGKIRRQQLYLRERAAKGSKNEKRGRGGSWYAVQHTADRKSESGDREPYFFPLSTEHIE